LARVPRVANGPPHEAALVELELLGVKSFESLKSADKDPFAFGVVRGANKVR
jgi:hypothetical protein